MRDNTLQPCVCAPVCDGVCWVVMVRVLSCVFGLFICCFNRTTHVLLNGHNHTVREIGSRRKDVNSESKRKAKTHGTKDVCVAASPENGPQ